MSKAKVLFIDDNVMLANIVTTALTDEGYVVHQQNSLTSIKAIIGEFQPDIMVLDIKVGTEDSIDRLPELHIVAPQTPVIIISSHTEGKEVARALRNKAAGYLKKPFEVDELVAYIERYACPATPFRIKIASLELDIQSRILYREDKEVKRLSKLEFALLVLLYEHRNEIVSREEIYHLWDEGTIVDNHSLYNLVAKLRNILSVDANIEISKSGSGYVLV